jgi:hypothetical protein
LGIAVLFVLLGFVDFVGFARWRFGAAFFIGCVPTVFPKYLQNVSLSRGAQSRHLTEHYTVLSI